MTSDDVPISLYHYTTIRGFLGILESHSLWATDYRFLNDTREVTSYIDGLRRAVERIDPNAPEYMGPPPKNETGIYLDHIPPDEWARQQVAAATDALSLAGTLGVVCFSKNSDQLSQWRGYAPGEQGIAIEFNAELLRHVAPGWTLAQVQYGDFEDHEYLMSIVERDRMHANDYPSVMAQWMTREILYRAAQSKLPSFYEEREWRLISRVFGAYDPLHHPSAPADLSEVSFRAGVQSPIPYVTLPLGDDRQIITGAVIGPGYGQALAANAAAMALMRTWGNYAPKWCATVIEEDGPVGRTLLEQTNVRLSTIPYRSSI